MSMDVKSIANMAVLAGEIMLRSGAETYRVEDTIKHIRILPARQRQKLL